MHRIAGENMNPGVDTDAKLESVDIRSSEARVLDTCMGLGYTAIGVALQLQQLANQRSSISSGRVTTIEYDSASLEMAAHNPWSSPLFDGELPIDIIEVRLMNKSLCVTVE